MAESGAMPDESLDFECPHVLGYLSGYPSDQPVPDECFGCPNAIRCMNHGTEAALAVADQEAEPE